MSFKISIASLKEALEAEKNEIKSLLDEMKKEKVDDVALKELLLKLESDITSFTGKVEDEFEIGLQDYDMVKFLKKMLELEYQGVFDYNYYASLVSDSELAESLRGFGAMEIEHAHLITGKIKKLGAKGKMPRAAKRYQFKTPLEMLKHHAKSEQEVVQLCEEGAKAFTDPEFQWILGTIRVDEIGHQKEIKDLIHKFEDIDLVFKVESKYNPPKDIDFDSDEPWVEG